MQAENEELVTPRDRLGELKREFFKYIDNNYEKVVSNIPIFYGYLVSSLDQCSNEIGDREYDSFIEEVTIKLLDTAYKNKELPIVEKICQHAIKSKKDPSAGTGIHLIAGMVLLNSGDFRGANQYFSPYADKDGIVGALVAYCYYMLSLREIAEKQVTPGARPGEMELLAREQMLKIARRSLPVGRLPQLQLTDQQMVNRAFWLMISCALDWFPSERRFLYIGIEKAKRDGNREMLNELLKIAVERFFDDMHFLRESFFLRIKEQDGVGAAGVVRQMMQQHPDDLEPIYYGLLLSVLTGKQPGFNTFRKRAVQNNMPDDVVQLMDLAFAVARRDRDEIENALKTASGGSSDLEPYLMLIEHLIQDIFSTDDIRRRKTRKVLLDSIDRYCIKRIQAIKSAKTINI